MRRVAYVSRSVVANGTTALQDIARVAMRLNSLQGITGLLLFDGFMFMQAIEGPDLATRECFERIRRDPRHQDLAVTADEPIGTKQFGSWSLLTLAEPLANGSAYVEEVHKAVTEVADAKLQAMFIGFASLRRR